MAELIFIVAIHIPYIYNTFIVFDGAYFFCNIVCKDVVAYSQFFCFYHITSLKLEQSSSHRKLDPIGKEENLHGHCQEKQERINKRRESLKNTRTCYREHFHPAIIAFILRFENA